MEKERKGKEETKEISLFDLEGFTFHIFDLWRYLIITPFVSYRGLRMDYFIDDETNCRHD